MTDKKYMRKNYSAIIIPTIILFVYGLTSNMELKQYVHYLFRFYLFFSSGALIYFFWLKQKKIKTATIPLIFYIITTTVLFWVGLTGWFFSPFFYFAYILGIVLAFIFSVRTTITYIGSLCLLFFYTAPQDDWFLNILILTSFAVIIPITHVLQRTYLSLKQQEKKILILEDEIKNYENNSLNRFLANKVDRFAIELRQPSADIRQLADYTRNIKDRNKIRHNLNKISRLGEELINKINHFEKQTTGKKVVHKKD